MSCNRWTRLPRLPQVQQLRREDSVVSVRDVWNRCLTIKWEFNTTGQRRVGVSLQRSNPSVSPEVRRSRSGLVQLWTSVMHNNKMFWLKLKSVHESPQWRNQRQKSETGRDDLRARVRTRGSEQCVLSGAAGPVRFRAPWGSWTPEHQVSFSSSGGGTRGVQERTRRSSKTIKIKVTTPCEKQVETKSFTFFCCTYIFIYLYLYTRISLYTYIFIHLYLDTLTSPFWLHENIFLRS